MKKVLSIILSLAMLLSMTAGLDFSALALDSSGKCGDNATYSFDSSTGKLTISGSGEIKSSAFSENKEIKSLIVNEGITAVGDYSFEECQNLAYMDLPGSVTTIGSGAFSGTALKDIAIPNGVKNIEWAAFGCDFAKSIEIPASVSYICIWSFYCPSLESIKVDSNNQYYDSRNDCNAIITKRDIIDSNGYIVLKANTLQLGCKNTVIPDTVTQIGGYESELSCNAFVGCTGLTSITIPDSVRSIASDAFHDCTGLTSVTIGKGVESINDNTFSGCSGLTEITVDSNNKYYDSRNNCNAIISKQDILDKYDDVATKANTLVAGCKNTVIPNSVTSIGDGAFSGCTGLTSVTIPDSVTSIGSYAFYNCTGLTSITIPDSVTSIGDEAFDECTGLTDVYYSGTEDEWNKIDIADGNDSLKNAKIHYLGKGNPEEPSTKPETPVTPNKPNNTKPSSKPALKASSAKAAAKPANNISAQIKAFSNISVKLKKVKKGKKSFTVQWKKAAGVDGYQIQYSLKKNMKKSKKKTVKASKSKLTVKNLKKGKKYYVRIRTYKTINGKKVYGKWSAKKTVKINKV